MESEPRPFLGTEDDFEKTPVVMGGPGGFVDDSEICRMGLADFLLDEHSLDS